ncbi:two-component system response regulator BtsR [Anaeromyxobacter oryzae]|uniref:DNA-binding response regulator n=1 Tax=Anaeromyxobacter oryzae TaxID=2918170 RepID=A0ABN6MM95_9BACT|nr:two-component system response regulator BtsR [Anaeromyxobacter oryzae]BDG02066.1 DNA-binding response regulator [Anaeromyxobacter oryzae]
MMRALIVDDELHAREELEALLVETGAFEIVGRCANAVEAMQALRREKPDVLFLDIQMPAISGLELLSMLDDAELPSVVFVTAHDEFALRAFEASAVDYLLKPVQAERLAKTVEKLRRLPGPLDRASLPPSPIVRIPCLAGRAIKLLDLSEVEVARSSEAGVYVLGPRGELFTELTLKVLEERAGLLRCHKQYLVNVDAVDEIHLEEGTIRTRSGKDVPVSRRFLPKLRERLGI